MGMANHHFFLVNTITIGGVSHFFYVHSLFGEMIQFDLRIFFQMGRFNHQLDQNGSHRIHGFGIFPYIYYHSCRKKIYYIYIYRQRPMDSVWADCVSLRSCGVSKRWGLQLKTGLEWPLIAGFRTESLGFFMTGHGCGFSSTDLPIWRTVFDGMFQKVYFSCYMLDG